MTFRLDPYKPDSPLPTSWYGIKESDLGYQAWLAGLQARAYKAYIRSLLVGVSQ